MHWKLQCRNKEQDKKILRLKLYGKIRNARLKMEPNVLALPANDTMHSLPKLLQTSGSNGKNTS